MKRGRSRGLWNSIAGTAVVESVMFVAGIAIYFTATRANDRIGRWAFWAMVLLLAIIYMATVQGQAPPSVTAVALSGIAMSVIVPVWVWWFDRHRTAAAGLAHRPVP